MAVTGYGAPVVNPYGAPVSSPAPNFHDTSGQLISSLTAGLFAVPGEPAPMNVPSIGLWPAGNPANVQQYRENYALSQPPPQPKAQGLTFPTLRPPAPLPQPGVLVNGQPSPNAHVTNFQTGPSAPATFDPAAQFNNQTPPPPLPGLNTSGTNPYLKDPLMAGYNGMQNPLYANQGQQDFYGDPELFSAPSAASATKG